MWRTAGLDVGDKATAMGMFSSLRSKMSGQTSEAFGEGERFPVNKQMILTIKRHVTDLKDTDITGYTFERRRSDYKGAKSDLVIYNDTQQPVLQGREPDSGPISIWPY
jgi:hypothetical protein